MRHFHSLFTLVILALLGCGGSPNASGGSGLTAKIDGTAWESDAIAIAAQTNFGVPGAVQISGYQSEGNKGRGITITLYNVAGPGNYALGTDISVIGGVATVGEGTGNGGEANVWITPGTGLAGDLELTKVGDGRVAGTFSYTTVPGTKNLLGGTRTVTEGSFDLPLKGTFMPLAENAGSKVTAELNGMPYNAGTVEGSLKDFTGGAGVTISTVNELNSLSIILVGVSATGTYAPLTNFAPQRLLVAGRNGGTAQNCCWEVKAADTPGEVVVTSLTEKRVKGTFSGTIKPQTGKPATQDLVITKGTFDIGIR